MKLKLERSWQKKGEEIRESGVTERKQSNHEKALELQNFCASHGNNITFIDEGDDTLEVEELNASEGVSLKSFLITLKKYLRNPIFIDEFGKDHSFETGRRGWEKKYEKFMRPDQFEYYDSNRLGNNITGQILPHLQTLTEKLEDSRIKDYLMNLKGRLEEEFAVLLQRDEDGSQSYNNLSVDARVDLVQNLSRIIKNEIIPTLESFLK